MPSMSRICTDPRHIVQPVFRPMEHPGVRPLFEFLEPLLALERQIPLLQSTLEAWAELHDNLEDANLTQAAHNLEQMIFGIQDLIAQLRVERQQVAIRILFTILINPDVWRQHFVAH